MAVNCKSGNKTIFVDIKYHKCCIRYGPVLFMLFVYQNITTLTFSRYVFVNLTVVAEQFSLQMTK